LSSTRIRRAVIPLAFVAGVLLHACGGECLHARTADGCAVRGTVTSAETGEPLENVNVYLSYTTVGASTDSGGNYIFRVPRPGAYDIVFSLVGFSPREERIELHAGDTLTLSVPLSPSLIETGPVEITSTPDVEWRKSLEEFARALIGRSEFSRECTLLNPGVLSFRRRGDTLTAATDHPLGIDNRALGYRLHLVIGEFTWNTAMDYGRFLIYPRFEPLAPADSGEARRWASNREKAFRGSIRDFFRSLIEGGTDAGSFLMYSGTLLMLQNGRGHRVADSDFSVEPYEGTPFLSVQFPGYVSVEYGESWKYQPGTDDALRRKYTLHRPTAPPPRVSVIRMTGSAVIVDSSGTLFDPLSVEVAGDWAEHRIEDLLPAE
jgi:hypothetical protein